MIIRTNQSKNGFFRYLRIDHIGNFYQELNIDYLERVKFWEEIMHKYDFTFGIN